MTKRKARKSICPSCNKKWNVDQQKGLKSVEQAWVKKLKAAHPDPSSSFHPHEDEMRRLAIKSLPNWFWACDSCIQAGKALTADIHKHRIGLGTSFAAYVDRPFVCEDCDEPSLFSAQEQQYWFETLQFLIWVYPKQCAPCRKKRREQVVLQKKLQAALKELDPSDAEQLAAVGKLYEAMGIEAKSILYQNRSNNKKSDEQEN